jgi:hypothetical protein
MQKKEPKKAVRRRPVAKWKLLDSIVYIKMRDKYLQETGILKKVGKRRWKLRIK